MKSKFVCMWSKIPSFLKNKYLGTLIVFSVYMFFFNDADVFSVVKSKMELKKLESEISWYKEKSAESKLRVDNLNEGGFALEKLAREKHYLQKENEDVFIVHAK